MSMSVRASRILSFAAVAAGIACASGCWVERIQIEPDGWDAGREDADASDADDVDEQTDVDVEVVIDDAGDEADSPDVADSPEDESDSGTTCGNHVVEPPEECERGDTASCTTACGSNGTHACTDVCDWALECTPPAETCNGIDDDCNDGIDEDWECPAGSTRDCAIGNCDGLETCLAGTCVWSGVCDPGPPPANDSCADAVELGAGGVFAGTTCGAADDHTPAVACGMSGAADVWYKFTLSQREVVYLDTVDGDTWNTALQVRWGSCPLPASAVICNDDACAGVSGGRRSQLVEVLDPGIYFVVVEGAVAGEGGPFALTFQRGECGAGSVRLAGSGNYDGSTGSAFDSLAGSCGGDSTPDVAYYFGLCAPATVTASTCNASPGFDSVLYFLSGGCGAGSEVACNDDDVMCGFGMGRSTVTANLPQGLSFLVVDGRRSSSGAYRVNVSGL